MAKYTSKETYQAKLAGNAKGGRNGTGTAKVRTSGLSKGTRVECSRCKAEFSTKGIYWHERKCTGPLSEVK
jgi:hypothetical protein